nr:MAG TPA: hypothetical protein [Caudoviricetes sp.]
MQPEVKFTIAEKTIRTELEKECMPMLCTVITSRHRLTVSCRTGKGAGRAKETPLRNGSTKGFAAMQNSLYLLCQYCKYNAFFLRSKLCGTF